MRSANCDAVVAEVGGSIAGSLRGVDCLAQEMTQDAFFRLFGAGGGLTGALTILLTLYVAFFAFQLITGRSRLGVSALTPRMLTLGLVLTFATSWVAYQSVVWNLATGAPDEIASVLTGVDGRASEVFAQKIDIVFGTIAEIAGGDETPDSVFSPPGLLWFGATLFLLGTVGLLVTSRIALAVLIALGPIFVVMALFQGTRGLFVGWLKGVVLLAIAPLFAVIGGSLMLELSVPVLGALGSNPNEIDPRAAMGFFMIGAVHVALMILCLKTATTMVAGWTVFGLAGGAKEDRADPPLAQPAPAAAIAASPAPALAAAGAATAAASTGGSRRIDISAAQVAAPANDRAPATPGRETRIYTPGPADRSSGGSAAVSRVRGIGSRFKSAPVRSTEKFK